MIPSAPRLGLAIALAAFVSDQASKSWLLDVMAARSDEIELGCCLNLVMVWNYGVSFGVLNEFGPDGAWGLVAVTLAIVVVLVVWLVRMRERIPAAALGLVIGGALGNVLDRLRFGAVADFFDFHLGEMHWPAFNVADSAIVIGAVVLVLQGLIAGRKERGS
jgi:signal peptidase II